MIAVSEEEVRWALKKGERRKAPSLDGLPWEFWQRFSGEFIGYLVDWCNKVLEVRQWPQGSDMGLLALLYKKEDREDMRN